MLLLVLGLAVPRLTRGLSRHAPVVLLPLTVTVEPSGAAAVAASCLDDWRRRRWLALLPKAGVALLALLTIHLTWREMPARGLSDALPLPHARAFLIALALLVLGLQAGDRINQRVRPAVLLHRFLLLWPGWWCCMRCRPRWSAGASCSRGWTASRVRCWRCIWPVRR